MRPIGACCCKIAWEERPRGAASPQQVHDTIERAPRAWIPANRFGDGRQPAAHGRLRRRAAGPTGGVLLISVRRTGAARVACALSSERLSKLTQ